MGLSNGTINFECVTLTYFSQTLKLPQRTYTMPCGALPYFVSILVCTISVGIALVVLSQNYTCNLKKIFQYCNILEAVLCLNKFFLLQGEYDNPKINAIYVMKGTLEGKMFQTI